MFEILLCFLWALVISMFAIPSIIYVAERKQLLNHPNERTTHIVSVPRLGGLAIFSGFISAIMIFGEVTKEVQYVLASCLVIFYIALKDDLVSVSAFKKFFVQILATGILVFIGDFRVTSFHGMLNIYQLDLGLSYAFTMVMIVAVTNSINLIDGIDGLAGTLVLLIIIIISATLYFYDIERPMILVAASLAGSLIGFLRYNLNKANIFMGDAGSLVCGLTVSALLITFIEKVPESNSPVLAMSIVFVPIVDTLRITVVRIFNGKSPFSSDKNHIHHKLLFAGLGSLSIVITLCLLDLFVFVLFFVCSTIDINISLFLFIVLLVITILVFQFLKEKQQQA